MPIEITSDWYTPELLRANPTKYYVFGDNTVREGKGGQAIIRHEPNAIGVATKFLPNNKPDSFFSDDHYENDISFIAADLKDIELHLILGKTVVLPAAGLGTGLSELPKRAPKINEYLQNAIEDLKRKYA